MTLRLSSFRARIFLVSLAVVISILALVGFISWTSAMSYEVDQLDARLCEETQRLVSFAPPANLDRLQRDAALKLRLQSPDQLLVWLRPGTGSILQSDRWPAGLEPNGWSWVERAEPVRAGRPDGASPRQRPELDGRIPADEAGANLRPDRGMATADDPGPPRFGTREPAARPRAPRSPCQVAGLVALGTDWRAAQVAKAGGKGVMAADLAGIRNTLNAALASIAWRAAPLALLLTGLGAWLMSALAMRPVARLQDTMDAVDQQSLEQRLPSEREDREFQALIGAYNRMLDRLEVSFRQAMRFSADAAHELRTPLTILQGQIEEAMRQSADLPTQVRLSQMLDEVIRLSTITRKLLLLSQADAGRLALLRTPVELEAMLHERLDDAKAALPGVTFSSDFAGRGVVPADPPLMDQLLNNLCGNACSYTPQGGWISVRLRGHDTGVEVVWTNSCLPLPPSSRERLFDRFYRGDPAHGRKIDGHGLGLSISREIARAHGGDLTLLDGPPDEFRLRLWLPHP